MSRALRRLLHVRALEEEQCRLALASALAELNMLEQALSAARAREHNGRILLVASLNATEAVDRTAAHVEMQAAVHSAVVLAPRIAAAQEAASEARQEYFENRIERRQVETLIEEAEAELALESSRGDQQVLDETFGSHQHRQKLAAQNPKKMVLAINRHFLIDREPETASFPLPFPDSGKMPKL